MFQELNNLVVSAAEKRFDVGRRAVAEADPDDLWRRALEKAEALKIFILRHEDESIGGSVGPDGSVTGRRQADVHDVD